MAHLLYNKEEFKKKIKVVKTSPSSKMTLSSTFANIPESQVEYTPQSGCDYVVYEFVTQCSFEDSDNNFYFQLQYGSDINNLQNITTNNTGYTSSYGAHRGTGSSRYLAQVKLVYTIPSWSGQKTLVVQSKSASTSYQSIVNSIDYAESGFTSVSDTFDCFVIIYSV